MLVEIYHRNDNDGYEDIYTSITEKNSTTVKQLSTCKDFIIRTFSSTIKEKKNYAIVVKLCDSATYTVDEYDFTIDIYDRNSQISFSGNLKMKFGDTICKYISDIDRCYENSANNLEEEEINPIDLSPNSFFVNENDGSIEVTCPEMCIGTVEESTFKIDETRQAAQDAFMKVMNRKMSNAHKKHEN